MIAFKPVEDDLNIIQKLDDEPNDIGGMTAAELKAKFDEGGNRIKNYINEGLLPALEEAFGNGPVFVVENGVTTGEELSAARNYGKLIFANVDGTLLPMADENASKFAGIIGDRWVEVTLNPSMGGAYGFVTFYRPAYAKEEYVDGAAAALTAKLPNKNLLANWYFPKAVNQRGAASYSAADFCIDRWRNTSGSGGVGTVSVEAGVGVTLSAGSCLIQRVPGLAPFLGKTLTVSALTGDGRLVSGTATLPETVSGGAKYLVQQELSDGTGVRLGRNANSDWLYVELRSGSSATTFVAAKLELGEVSTLSVTALPDEGASETDRCKWYFERIKAVDTNLTIGMGSGAGNKLYCSLKLAPKRTAPSAEALAACASSLRYGTTTLTNTPTAVNLYSFDPDSGYCTLEMTGSITAGTAYRVGIAAGGWLDFNSEV